MEVVTIVHAFFASVPEEMSSPVSPQSTQFRSFNRQEKKVIAPRSYRNNQRKHIALVRVTFFKNQFSPRKRGEESEEGKLRRIEFWKHSIPLFREE